MTKIITSVKIQTPKPTTVEFIPYMNRGTQKAIRRVVASYPEVDLTAAQKKFAKIGDLKTQEEQMTALRAIPAAEQDAVLELQEVMVKNMAKKIVVDDEGELDSDEFARFFDEMRDEDFVKLSLCISKIVAESSKNSEKKTKKS